MIGRGDNNWVDVCHQSELSPGRGKLIEHNGSGIAVYNVKGELFALEDSCTHDDFPLLGCGLPQDLVIHGETITCPRHGARFSIRTGEALCAPACEPLRAFAVRVEGEIVQIDPDRDS